MKNGKGSVAASRLVWWGGVLLCLACCCGTPFTAIGVYFFWPGGKVTQANFDRLAVGMTLAEVEAILGKGENLGEVNVDIPGMEVPGFKMPAVKQSAANYLWRGTRNEGIALGFQNGRVSSKMFVPNVSAFDGDRKGR